MDLGKDYAVAVARFEAAGGKNLFLFWDQHLTGYGVRYYYPFPGSREVFQSFADVVNYLQPLGERLKLMPIALTVVGEEIHLYYMVGFQFKLPPENYPFYLDISTMSWLSNPIYY